MITVEFLITSLIVVLIPGTGVVFTVSTGLAQGRKASVFAAPGVAYLLYLAYATWKNKAAFVVERVPSRSTAFGIVIKAILLNILNPKLTIFFLAFLPQFVEPGASSPLAQLLVLSGVFMAMTFGVFVVYGLLAHAFRRAVIESPRVQSWLRRGFAATFAGLGVQLAVTER
jgi:threonine/homoserine/homoserine lactone efflux protein